MTKWTADQLPSLSGTTVVITGATGGVGLVTARELARAGATVVLAARDVDKARRLVSGDVEAHRLDVADLDSVRAFARSYTGPVDILINNAGITRDTTFHRMTSQQWGEVVNTNLNSVFNMTRPVIEGMRERKWGRIIQISSINGLKGQYGQANYAAAKAGMHGFTISLARENAKLGITVNTVSPGYVATDMVMAVPEEVRAKIAADIPTGRLGKPEEIAYAVAFLEDDQAAWITGSNLDINGGHHMGW
jgi:acetoacetyl-CoA reductase